MTTKLGSPLPCGQFKGTSDVFEMMKTNSGECPLALWTLLWKDSNCSVCYSNRNTRRSVRDVIGDNFSPRGSFEMFSKGALFS